jgi:hypothetical protein
MTVLAAALGVSALGVACSSATGESISSSSSAATSASPQSWTGPLGAADLEKWYDVPTDLPSSGTLAILSYADDGQFDSDLAVYRAQYGLPPCTQASGCLRKVTENGGAAVGSVVPAQTLELALDMASAGCPACKLLVVELTGPKDTDLLSALQTAQALGAGAAVYVDEGIDNTSVTDAQLLQTGVTLFVGRQYVTVYGWPEQSAAVIDVGATTITRDTEVDGTGVGGSEAATPTFEEGWCTLVPKPAWQKDTGCQGRTTSDVSATSGPAWSYSTANGGWSAQVGFQVAAPLVAGIFMQAGKGHAPPSYPYTNAAQFTDLYLGTELAAGASCVNALGQPMAAYVCTAGVGYDGPTGIGTPNGYALAGVPLNVFFMGPGGAFQVNGNVMSALTVSPGLTSANSLTVGAGQGWPTTSTLSLSFSGLPDGVTVALSPVVDTIQGGLPWVDVHLKAASDAPYEQRIVTVTGTGSDGATHQTQFEAVVQPCVSTTTCASVYAQCGSIVDNCGNTVTCADTCAAGLVCSENQCVKCAIRSCPTGSTFSETTCACEKDVCPCGGVYPSCKLCQ